MSSLWCIWYIGIYNYFVEEERVGQKSAHLAIATSYVLVGEIIIYSVKYFQTNICPLSSHGGYIFKERLLDRVYRYFAGLFF